MAFTVQGVIQLITDDYNKKLQKAKKDGETTVGAVETAFGKFGNKLKAFKKAIPVVAIGAACAGVYKLAKATADAGDAIDKNSQKLGMSRKAYQEWGYILGQNGSSIETMSKALKTMTANMTSGSASTSEALQKIGLSMDKLAGKSREAQFQMMVEGLQGMADGSEKMALAQTLFGQSAQDLMPLLNAEAGSIEDLMMQANKLGIILDDETIDAAAGFGDALDNMGQAWNGLKLKMGSQFLKPFTQMFTKLADAIGNVSVAMGDSIKTGDWSIFFRNLADQLAQGVPDLVGGLIDVAIGAINSLDEIITLAGSIASGLIVGVVRALPVLWAKLPAIMSSITTSLKDVIALMFGDMFAPLTGIVNSVIDTVGNILGTIYGMLSGQTSFADGISKLFDDIFGDGPDGTSGLLGIFSNILATASGLIDGILENLGVSSEKRTQIMTWVNEAFGGLLNIGNDIVGIFSGANSPDGKSLIQRVIGALTVDGNMATKMNNAIKALFGSSKDGELSGLLGIAGKVRNSFAGLVSGIIGTLIGDQTKAGQIGDLVRTIFDAPLNIVDTIINTFTGKDNGDGTHSLGLIDRIFAIFDPTNNSGFATNLSNAINTLFGVGEGNEGLGFNGLISSIETSVNGMIGNIAALFGIQADDERVKKITDGVSTLFGGVRDVVSDIVKIFTGDGEGEDHKKGLIEQIGDIFTNPTSVAETISGFISTVFGTSTPGSEAGLLGVAGRVKSGFVGLVDSIISTLTGDVNKADAISGIFDTILSGPLNIVESIINTFTGKGEGENHQKGLIERIQDIFDPANNTDFPGTINAFLKTLFGIGEGNEGMGLNGIVTLAENTVKGIITGWVDIFDIDPNDTRIASITSGIESLFGGVTNVVNDIVKIFTGDGEGEAHKKGIIELITDVFNGDTDVKTGIENAFRALFGLEDGATFGIAKVISDIQGAFTGVMDSVLELFGVDKESETYKKFEDGINDVFGFLTGTLTTWNNTLFGTKDAEGNQLTDGLITAFSNLFDPAVPWDQKISSFVSSIYGSDTPGSESGLIGLVANIKNAFQNLTTDVLGMFGVDTNSEEYKTFMDSVDLIFGAITGPLDAIKTMWTGVKDDEGNVLVKGLSQVFAELFDPDVSWATKVDDFIGAIFGNSGQDGKPASGLLGIGSKLQQSLSGLMDNMLNWIFGDNATEENPTIKTIKGLFDGAFSGLLGIGDAVANMFKGGDGKKGILTVISEALTSDESIWTKIQNVWTTLFGSNEEGNKSGIYGIVDSLVSYIKTIPGMIAETLGLDDEWVTLINQASEALGSGFLDMIGGFGDFFGTIVDVVGKITSGDFSGAISTLTTGLFGENGLIAKMNQWSGALVGSAASGLLHLLGMDITPEQVKQHWNNLTDAILTPLRWLGGALANIVKSFEFLFGIRDIPELTYDAKSGTYADLQYNGTEYESTMDLLTQFANAMVNGYWTNDLEFAVKQMFGLDTNTGKWKQGGQERYEKFYDDLFAYAMNHIGDDGSVSLPEDWFAPSAQSAVSAVAAALNGTKFTATLQLTPEIAGAVGSGIMSQTEGAASWVNGHHATGLDYVPFDNYVARLHRGEAVLSAFEAAAWRERGNLYGGTMGNTYNDSSTLYVGQMYMSNELDAAQLQQTLATMTRRRNRSYGA